ncbi:PilZ domain-containing protein [Rhodovulum sp. P5]|uniref:PilZ domain-containing protein n=1 Tax=Rhodovulum sp. P5 TaxID=1564506 RepID=UPI0009D9A1ED|nr:PilZ domain-containing protein [Rhodovulum sp. P5]
MSFAPAFRALIMSGLVLLFAGAPARASDECPLHDWLLWIYTQGESLVDAPDAPETQRQAMILSRVVAGADEQRLARLMGMVGLEEDMPIVSGYIGMLRGRLISINDPETYGKTAKPDAEIASAQSALMRNFIQNLKCEKDPDWKAEVEEPVTVAAHVRVSGERNVMDVENIVVVAVVLASAIALIFPIVWLVRRVSKHFDRRNSVRHPCRMRAVLHIDDVIHETMAVDISRHGAKLDLRDTLGAQKRYTLEIGELSLPGKITWSNPHYVGFVFAHAIDQDAFDELLEKHQWEPVESGAPDGAPAAQEPPSGQS